jgi:perosamine synthetase
MGEEEREAVARVLDSGRLVLGPEVEQFEAELARLCGVPHAVAVSSGTAALHLALWALGVGSGDEVVVPALTFPAPAAAALAVGATPVPADVDEASWNLSVEALRAALGPRTRAVIVVDQFGAPADWHALPSAVPEGVAVIEDAACALAASFGGRPCGSFGDVATLSFHPRKVVTTGEGGAVLTRRGEIADRVRALRDHGRLRGTFATWGLNLRLGEVQAAIGRCQLARLSGLVDRREALAQRYISALTSGEARDLGLACQRAPAGARSSWQTFAVLLPERAAATRAQLLDSLASESIEATVASYCLPRIEPYRKVMTRTAADVPVSAAVDERGIALPLHPRMAEHDVDLVIAALGRAWQDRGMR